MIVSVLKHKHHFTVTPDRTHKICRCGTVLRLRRSKRPGARRRS